MKRKRESITYGVEPRVLAKCEFKTPIRKRRLTVDDEIDLEKKLEELKRENTSSRNEVYRSQEELLDVLPRASPVGFWPW